MFCGFVLFFCLQRMTNTGQLHYGVALVIYDNLFERQFSHWGSQKMNSISMLNMPFVLYKN